MRHASSIRGSSSVFLALVLFVAIVVGVRRDHRFAVVSERDRAGTELFKILVFDTHHLIARRKQVKKVAECSLVIVALDDIFFHAPADLDAVVNRVKEQRCHYTPLIPPVQSGDIITSSAAHMTKSGLETHPDWHDIQVEIERLREGIATAISALEDFQEEAVTRVQSGEDGIASTEVAPREIKNTVGPAASLAETDENFVTKSLRFQADKSLPQRGPKPTTRRTTAPATRRRTAPATRRRTRRTHFDDDGPDRRGFFVKIGPAHTAQGVPKCHGI